MAGRADWCLSVSLIFRFLCVVMRYSQTPLIRTLRGPCRKCPHYIGYLKLHKEGRLIVLAVELEKKET